MSFPLVALAVLIISFVHQRTFGFDHGFAATRDPNHLLLDASKFDFNGQENHFIEPPLDHFNSSDRRNFRLFYGLKLNSWQTNGPIYITYGNMIFDNKTMITQLARETNGAMYGIGLRYYFSSLPDIPQDNLTEYYKYFDFRQDMADLAYFVKSLKSDPKYKSSKVVVIGCGYTANFAVWSRELYPDLVDAAVSSSETVLARTDFEEYLQAVANIYRTYGGEGSIIRMATRFSTIDYFLKSSEGIKFLKGWLNICPESDLTVLENQQLVFYLEYARYANVAQNGDIKDIYDICKKISLTDKFNVGLSFLKQDRSDSWTQRCRHINYTIFFNLTDPYTYNTCSQVGTFITSTGEEVPFTPGLPLEFELNACKNFFNGDFEDIEKRVDEGVARTNTMFGGRTPNVTKVVFSTGDRNPWHFLGVQKDLGPDAPVYVINQTRCCDVLYADKHEPEELTKHREHVKELVKKWISSP